MPLVLVAVVALSAAGATSLRARGSHGAGASDAGAAGEGTPSIFDQWLRPADRRVDGVVVDAETEAPVAGALVVSGKQRAISDADGAYTLGELRTTDSLRISLPGYVDQTIAVRDGGAIRSAIVPRLVRLTVRDDYSGGPVGDAAVRFGDRVERTDGAGAVTLRAIPLPSELRVEAADYAPGQLTVDAETDATITLRPNVLRGQVIDARSQQPLAGAQILVGGRTVVADRFGNYRVENVPPDVAIEAFARGYGRATLAASRTPVLDVRLEPKVIKGVYMSYFVAGSDDIRADLINLIKRTELNAIVVDFKGDHGRLLFGTDVPLAKAIGAQDGVMVDDIDAFLREMHAANIYVIARIVTFKDTVLAHAHPEWAITDETTGQVWVDDEGLAWTDPFRTEVWDYNRALAVEAARHGFDEVQFDYIRFPTDGKVGSARTSRENTEENRVEAITGFLASVKAALAPYQTALAIDTFGYTTLRDDDMGIGQLIERLAPHVDVICPMVYPSTFQHSIPGVANPVAQPYDIIYKTTSAAIKRMGTTGTQVRPWLQDFPDYAFDRRPYGQAEVKAQIKAADDVGAPGWLLWDPRNRYTAAALAPKR